MQGEKDLGSFPLGRRAMERSSSTGSVGSGSEGADPAAVPSRAGSSSTTSPKVVDALKGASFASVAPVAAPKQRPRLAQDLWPTAHRVLCQRPQPLLANHRGRRGRGQQEMAGTRDEPTVCCSHSTRQDVAGDWHIAWSKLKKEEELGKGSFKVVFRGKYLETPVAIGEVIGIEKNDFVGETTPDRASWRPCLRAPTASQCSARE